MKTIFQNSRLAVLLILCGVGMLHSQHAFAVGLCDGALEISRPVRTAKIQRTLLHFDGMPVFLPFTVVWVPGRVRMIEIQDAGRVVHHLQLTTAVTPDLAGEKRIEEQLMRLLLEIPPQLLTFNREIRINPIPLGTGQPIPLIQNGPHVVGVPASREPQHGIIDLYPGFFAAPDNMQRSILRGNFGMLPSL